jgi:hypothetical protein
MAWRIHFTAEDLERIQVSPTLGPLAETVMALELLACPLQPHALSMQWRSRASGKITAQMKPLTAVIPPGFPGVDLCTLTGEAATIEQGVQALLAMPRERVLTEMEFTDRYHKLPAAAWAAAETGSQARRQLATAAQAAYQALVVLRSQEFRRLARLEVRQDDRLLARSRPVRLIPGRPAHLGSDWLSRVDPAGGPVRVTVSA